MSSNSTRKVRFDVNHGTHVSRLCFYPSEKEHIRLEYSQRMKLLALFKQVKVGPYSPDKDSDTGYFDVVGADRR